MEQRFEGVRSNPAMQGTACRAGLRSAVRLADAAPDQLALNLYKNLSHFCAHRLS